MEMKILKKISTLKDFLRENKIGVFIVSFFFIIDLVYLSNTTANVPMMDYWRYGNNFLSSIFNGGIRFDDLWESINGQRAILNYILFLSFLFLFPLALLLFSHFQHNLF